MYAVLAAVAVGGALQAWGAHKAAKARARAIREAAEATARSYRSAAAEALQAGEYEVFKSRMQGDDIMGEAKVVQGASRLDDGDDALRKTAFMTELDAGVLRMNARRAAWGLQRQAREALEGGASAARAVREEGRAAVLSSLLGTGSTLALYGSKYGGDTKGKGA